jgi:hypothetical protein
MAFKDRDCGLADSSAKHPFMPCGCGEGLIVLKNDVIKKKV